MVQEQISHKVTMQERKALTMTGVTEVVSFDDRAVVLQTCMGNLVVHGQGLQLKQLSQEGGQMSVEGEISALVYESAGTGRSFWGRLFG